VLPAAIGIVETMLGESYARKTLENSTGISDISEDLGYELFHQLKILHFTLQVDDATGIRVV
jgi:hypothetical protein